MALPNLLSFTGTDERAKWWVIQFFLGPFVGGVTFTVGTFAVVWYEPGSSDNSTQGKAVYASGGMTTGDDFWTSDSMATVYLLAIFALCWLTLSSSVRRLHDLGQRGGWVVLILIPLVNIAFSFWLGFAPGKRAGQHNWAPNYLMTHRSALPPQVLAEAQRSAPASRSQPLVPRKEPEWDRTEPTPSERMQ